MTKVSVITSAISILKCFYFIFNLLFFLLFLFCTTHGFNIDTVNPIYWFGSQNTMFGFSIAQHFINESPVLLIGAPRANSSQPGTIESGVVFACKINFKELSSSFLNINDCISLQIEYPTNAEFAKPPHFLNSKLLHKTGKNNQLLGFVVQSTGIKYGKAMACAPLLRYGQNAYTDGACYLLNNELNYTGVISTCNPLPKKNRHNDYGACEQGFSGFIDQNVILTGLPGARKWTGGVFGRYEFTSNSFPDTVDRWTMEVNKKQQGIINILTSHDYLGYSVSYGRFGFWYEEENGFNFTIISGATRYQQTGAVIFLPFCKNSHPEEERLLGLNDNFTIVGHQLGSGFGSSVQVIDLNADGFDDLIVGAPYEFYFEEDIEFGGAVYIYYSAGKKQKYGANNQVFLNPIILRVSGAHSQFGISITKLGNIDNDVNGYQDFAVGAPYLHNGKGAVFIYHGADYNFFKTTPAQEIHPNLLEKSYINSDLYRSESNKKQMLEKLNKLSTFGASLAGNVDMDGNNYNELAVGAFRSDAVILFRTKPIINLILNYSFPQQYIKIDDRRLKECPVNARTCFSITTQLLTVNQNNTAQLLNFDENPFLCSFEIISFVKNVATRTLFIENNKTSISWACGRKSLKYFDERNHKIYVLQSNQDWIHPLYFNFSVLEQEKKLSELNPIINKMNSNYIFNVSFDKKCGDDNDCHTDLSLSAILLNITRNEDGTYLTKVTERDVIVIKFVVTNKKERAFLAKLFIEYNQNELDVPQKLQQKSPIDIEKKENGIAVIMLGNPLEEKKQLNFDLSFNLVRGSSERVSASLIFKANINSTSIEDNPLDNTWKTEVKLIKEADLQLNGASRPFVVHFSKGNKDVIDEEDIGQEVIHVYTLNNYGPFYAKNVTVTIHWPLKLNSKRNSDDWILYVLEEPVIRHNGEIRKCKSIESNLINPLNIYNDETLRLTYNSENYLRKPRSVSKSNLLKKHNEKTDDDFNFLNLLFNKNKLNNSETLSSTINKNSIFDSGFIKTKEIVESSGSRVQIVDVNCKDETALCIPIICHFDYVGTNDAALIEIRARLWNYTFSGNHKSIEYFAITSDGYVEVDSSQGIIENIENNFARVTTHAYPDRPLQDDHIDIWIVLLAILVGLLLLGILILICGLCGFFERKHYELHLHQAHRLNELEQWN